MKMVKKLAQNLGWRALRVLGAAVYAKYLFTFLANLRPVLRTRNFVPLDQGMGSRPLRICMEGTRFTIDCPFTDQRIQDGSFTFGIIREMFIRNCYLRHGVAQAARSAETVLDLGANRGTFSVMMAGRARLVIAVECQSFFEEVIAHNMKVNGFTNYVIEPAFVGSGGKCGEEKQSGTTIPELLKKHGLEQVDLAKIDIEGSEFSLFKSPEWLATVSAICMEVHPEYGNVQTIVDALSQHGFSLVVGDSQFRPVHEPQQAEYIWAWKTS